MKTKAELEAENRLLKARLDLEESTSKVHKIMFDLEYEKSNNLSHQIGLTKGNRIADKIEHEVALTRYSKGANKTNNARREFWIPWQARYRVLRAEGMRVEQARIKVGDEIVAAGGKAYTLDGALKKNLKD